MLIRTQVTATDTVLATGASGDVGSAAVQLAKARGAAVIAVTSRDKTADILRLGADQTVLRDDNLVETLRPNSVDVVIDLVAGSQWPQFLDILRSKGRYGVAGAVAGPIVELHDLKGLSFFGCTVLEPEAFPNLIKSIESGAIFPYWLLKPTLYAKSKMLKRHFKRKSTSVRSFLA